MGVFGTIALSAAAAVFVIWLAVSFTSPGRGRTLLEWLGASGLYVALLSLFIGLFLNAREADSLAGQLGFGLLALIFGSGLLLSLVKGVGSLRGVGGAGASATN